MLIQVICDSPDDRDSEKKFWSLYEERIQKALKDIVKVKDIALYYDNDELD